MSTRSHKQKFYIFVYILCVSAGFDRGKKDKSYNALIPVARYKSLCELLCIVDGFFILTNYAHIVFRSFRIVEVLPKSRHRLLVRWEGFSM